MPPPQTPVNVPAIDVGVWLETWYWKLPHVDGLGSTGSAFDSQSPTSDAVVAALVLGLAAAMAATLAALGASVLAVCSKAHPTAATVDASATSKEKVRFMVIT